LLTFALALACACIDAYLQAAGVSADQLATLRARAAAPGIAD
jgi:hypothetical protein